MKAYHLVCSQTDLGRIKMAFVGQYEESLYDRLNSEVRGDFKKMLMSVCGMDTDEERELYA